MRRSISRAAAVALGLLLHASAWAGGPTEQLHGLFSATARILEDPRTEDKRDVRLSAIRTLARGIFDFREAARLSLGPEWDERTPVEQDEFVRLFADLLDRSFIVGVASRIRLADGVKVSYLGESIDGAVATVRTTIVCRSGLELPFDYRMIERGGRWAVRDVVIDGVSLAANYRAQFARIIQVSSYRELVQQMQAKASGLLWIHALPPESTEARPRAALAPAAPDPSGLVAPVAERFPPPAIPNARVEVTPVSVRPDRAVEDAPPRRSQDQAAPRERGVQPGPLQAMTATTPALRVPVATFRSYWVQVGAFKDSETARQLASLLRKQERPASGRPTVIVEPVPTGVQLTRVRVGPFADRVEAAAKLRDLKTRGYQPFIAEERD